MNKYLLAIIITSSLIGICYAQNLSSTVQAKITELQNERSLDVSQIAVIDSQLNQLNSELPEAQNADNQVVEAQQAVLAQQVQASQGINWPSNSVNGS